MRRSGGPTQTNKPGEYRVWLADWPSEECRLRFLELAQEAKEAQSFQIWLTEHVATLTFVSSGDLKADIKMIDTLLKEATR